MKAVPASNAGLVACLLAVDPVGLGGVVLRGGAGPGRDAFLTEFCALLPEAAPWRRLPLSVSDARLTGGLDVSATLRAGRPIAERGLLAEADGGVVLVAMAERISPFVTAQLCAALDSGLVATARDGVEAINPARFACVALDEGMDDTEAAPAALRDRLAFLLPADVGCVVEADTAEITAARVLLPSVALGEEMLRALTGTAYALGVDSTRAQIFTLRAARAAAALAGHEAVTEQDAQLAAALVLAPRATRVPEAEEQDQPEPEPPPPEGEQDTPPEQQNAPQDGPVADQVLEAAKAAIPEGLLTMLQSASSGARAKGGGKSGAWQKSGKRGRPGVTRRGTPGPMARLNLIETLRAAAPWQHLRRAESDSAARILVRPEDITITRFRQRRETTTIFVVDASGSLATNRLAEAKGAIELLLADCYVRRDMVAMVAFRALGAELLLPPTRSLVRAKRGLRLLPGGGGTPLAAGLLAARDLADMIARRGGTPALVLLTDGSANIALDGTQGRPRAMEDALAQARMLRHAGHAMLLVDTAPRPAKLARALADMMSASYLAMPYADANNLSRAVQSAMPVI